MGLLLHAGRRCLARGYTLAAASAPVRKLVDTFDAATVDDIYRRGVASAAASLQPLTRAAPFLQLPGLRSSVKRACRSSVRTPLRAAAAALLGFALSAAPPQPRPTPAASRAARLRPDMLDFGSFPI